MKKIKAKLEHFWHVFKRHVLYDVLDGNFAKPAHFVRTAVKHKLFDYPYLAMVETASFCNLKCPTCTTPHDKIKRPKVAMSLENYKKIIDNVKDSVSVVLPWFSNDPLVNPRMAEMIKYSHQNNMYTVISTNAVLLDEKRSKELLNSGLDEAILCLDGMSKESYEVFREGAVFEEVLENIKNFCRLKKESGRRKPYVELQFILTKFNQGEVEDVKRLAKELGVDRLRIKSFALSEYAYSKEEIKELSEKFLPDDPRYASKIRYEKKGGDLAVKNRKKFCELPSSNIVALADGRLAMCCYDINGQYIYGNVLEKPLREFWHLPEVRSKRKKAGRRGYPLCEKCAN
ncbi:MAG: radical SAM protein [Candidatus Pacebacteria bacterium]|nr:radical SAM protein [Candidatus Paceibacterota bacterium]NUQ57088.1 radical SAM protein [Candidatus Paceibacter sp.]